MPCVLSFPAVQSTIADSNSPTGRTWYDSLQMKGTHRLSHGLQINGTFTWSKALVGIRPNLFVESDKVDSDPPTSPSSLMRTSCIHNAKVPN